MIKGAIFDLDGTLTDSMELWETVADEYLISVGKTPKPGLRAVIYPMTLFQAAEYMIGEYDLTDSVEDIVKSINQIVADLYKYKVPLKENVLDFLKLLKSAGIPMCVATVTEKHHVEAALKRLGIMDFFKGIITTTMVGSDKSKPDIYRAAAEFIGTDKENTCVFEDAYHAAKTAKDDGFIVAGIFDRFEKRTELIKEFADYYITDYKDADVILK